MGIPWSDCEGSSQTQCRCGESMRTVQSMCAVGKVCAAVGMFSAYLVRRQLLRRPPPTPRWRSVYTAWATSALLLGNSATSLYYSEASRLLMGSEKGGRGAGGCELTLRRGMRRLTPPILQILHSATSRELPVPIRSQNGGEAGGINRLRGCLEYEWR